jgi:cell division protein FtsW (lipid II flippase)
MVSYMRIGTVWFGTAFVIFVIFFGLALLEAVRVRDWIAAVLWLGAGLAFLAADNLRRGRFPLPPKSRS